MNQEDLLTGELPTRPEIYREEGMPAWVGATAFNEYAANLEEICTELRQRVIELTNRMGAKPKQGEKWRHHSGSQYEVLCLTNENSNREDFIPTVVYRCMATGMVWSRPLSEWNRSFVLAFPTQKPPLW